MAAEIEIRQASECDWAAIWTLLEPVFRAGETYAVERDISESDARRMWMESPQETYVACDDNGALLGTYYIKPNYSGPAAHVCNCGYVVGESARGRGIASAMCDHSQGIAVALGFLAMQYNLVVSSNAGAVRLWKRHGFEIVGTIPAAFRHPTLGLVHAYVMHKHLSKPGE